MPTTRKRARKARRPRRRPSLLLRLAAALVHLRDGQGERLIPHESAKLMTAKQIVSLFNFDHYPIKHVDGGPDAPWNLEPLLAKPHRIKTATVDIPQIAKDRRIDAKWDKFMRDIRRGKKPGARLPKKRHWPKQSFPNRKRKSNG